MGLFSLKIKGASGAFSAGLQALQTYRSSGASSAVTGLLKNTISSSVGSAIESKINKTLYRITGDTGLDLNMIKSGLGALGIGSGLSGFGGLGLAASNTTVPSHSGYLQNVNDLAQVEWNTDHLWDIKLADAAGLPAYFQGWLPVIDLEEEASHVNTRDFQMGTTTIVIAEGTHAASIQIVFLDDAQNSLFSYFTTWMNQIVGGSTGRISPMGDSYKMLYVKKLNRQRNTVEIRPYKVVPTGTLTFSGKSQGDLSQYMLKFEIIGSPGASKDASSNALDLMGAVSSLLPKTSGKVGSGLDGLINSANSAIDRVAMGMNTMVNDASSAFDSAVGGFASKFDTVAGGAADSLDSGIASLSDKVSSGYKGLFS